MMANRGVPGFESPMRRTAIALTFIKGPKVDAWVETMLQILEQLDPATENVEYIYTNFLDCFQTQFTNSTKQESAQAALDRLTFKFPFIDQYVSDFEGLVRKAGYTVGSRESMNYFLKGLNSAPDVVEKVVEKFPTDYQDLKDKAVLAVKAKQLIRAMRNSGQPPFQRPQQQQPFALRSSPPRFNSSNAPPSWNNCQVPMDLSRGRFPPNRNAQRQFRGNAAQMEQPTQWGPRPPRVRKCYNCDKPGHFAAECRQPKRTRSQQAYVQDYMDEEEDLSQLQEALNPANLLDNALKVFDTLPLDQKDTLIAKYEGKKEDFPAA
jgi:Zinc knuckle